MMRGVGWTSRWGEVGGGGLGLLVRRLWSRPHFPPVTDGCHPFRQHGHGNTMLHMACWSWHEVRMILSWKDASTRRFAETGRSRWSGLDVAKARIRLQTLHAATSLSGLGQLRSVGLHKLSGDRAGYWAMTINGPYRLVFRFEDGDAHDVEIVDYH